ncbi:hypothetical protein C8R46DRAFT_1226649 [Mycena filopes]|nr:hypothetical protein C8R46DRAFT_1226649 [Mycena filopes]
MYSLVAAYSATLPPGAANPLVTMEPATSPVQMDDHLLVYEFDFDFFTETHVVAMGKLLELIYNHAVDMKLVVAPEPTVYIRYSNQRPDQLAVIVKGFIQSDDLQSGTAYHPLRGAPEQLVHLASRSQLFQEGLEDRMETWALWMKSGHGKPAGRRAQHQVLACISLGVRVFTLEYLARLRNVRCYAAICGVSLHFKNSQISEEVYAIVADKPTDGPAVEHARIMKQLRQDWQSDSLDSLGADPEAAAKRWRESESDALAKERYMYLTSPEYA